jgi:hypothetical protein
MNQWILDILQHANAIRINWRCMTCHAYSIVVGKCSIYLAMIVIEAGQVVNSYHFQDVKQPACGLGRYGPEYWNNSHTQVWKISGWLPGGYAIFDSIGERIMKVFHLLRFRSRKIPKDWFALANCDSCTLNTSRQYKAEIFCSNLDNNVVIISQKKNWITMHSMVTLGSLLGSWAICWICENPALRSQHCPLLDCVWTSASLEKKQQ